MIQEETNCPSTDLYLGKDAWKAFRKHADVKEALDNRRINAGELDIKVGKKLRGEWNGLNVYTVSGTYVDMDGSVKHFLDPKFAMLQAAGAIAETEYGLPMDLACEGPTEVFAKLFEQEDPSGIFSLCETRPLPWVKQPGWVVLTQVLE